MTTTEQDDRTITPAVFLISESKIVEPGGPAGIGTTIFDYLELVGAGDYDVRQCASHIEDLIMIGGKLCYKSFKEGLNPNVTKIRNDAGQYLTNINKQAHGSVLEHGYIGFIFYNVSRVFTHEEVRHRTGIAFSQESLRYVRLTDLRGYLPTCLRDEWGKRWHREKMEEMSRWQKELAEHYEIDQMKDFSRKKELTSAFRRYAPIGLSTAIMCSMNVRTARHIIQMRTAFGAEEEIRLVFDAVALLCVQRYPQVFGDFNTAGIMNGIKRWRADFAAMPYDQEKLDEKTAELNKLRNELQSYKDELDYAKLRLARLTNDG